MTNDDMTYTLSFFGLKEQPFAPTADPAYFYATNEHKECLFRLWSSIDERHGIAVVLGNYGTGKTTLLRKLMTGMAATPERYVTAVLGSPIPSWTSFALLDRIVSQFGLKPANRSFVSYMDSLNEFLMRNRNDVCTLVIDDAQNLNKRGQLELLRLVQNLETPQHKLLNLILFAQLEWAQVLKAVPNFEQRINMTYTLGPIAPGETKKFINYRLEQAGSDMSRPIFDDTALRAIHAYAEGSPRVIVTLCRNALLVAAHVKTRPISQDIILHTIGKTTLPDSQKRARVLAVLDTSSAKVPAPEPPFAAMPQEPERESAPLGGTRSAAHPYEERISQMLLRAARRRSGGGAP